MPTQDLYSTVVNTSGKKMYFSWLGPNGVELDPGASYTVWGHVQHSFGQGSVAKSRQKSLEQALNDGLIEITSGPRPIIPVNSPTAQIANPLVANKATVSVGGSGATLAAGKYQVAYTWANDWGETTVGASISDVFTVTLGQVATVTVPAQVALATKAKVYITKMDATTPDPTTLRYHGEITSGTTLAINSPVAADNVAVAPPTTNTTKSAVMRVLEFTGSKTIGTLTTDDPDWGRYTG